MNNIKTIFTIKDLENISGIKAHTIRIWEKRYDLLKPSRTDTNIRYYSADSLMKLMNVTLLNKHNHKISKIAKMSNEEIVLNTREIAFKFAVEDEAISAFKIAMFQFDKVLFNSTYNRLLHRKTFREIFKEIFIPFLNEIGLLWQTKTLLPAHEHFISNLIIQKIQLNTEKLEYAATNKDFVYVLFLPENEIHEIGLLYLNYELVLRGAQTVYLGESLPLDNLDYFFQSELDVCFVTSMSLRPYNEELNEYFGRLDKILKNTDNKLLAFGKKTKEITKTDFKSEIKLYDNVIDLLDDL